jgi:hypothetical protein
MKLTNITDWALCARIFVPDAGHGPSVVVPPDHEVFVKGPKRKVMLLSGDQHLHFEGSFILDPEHHDPAAGFLFLANRQCLHKLPCGAVLQVWVHGESPEDVNAS